MKFIILCKLLTMQELNTTTIILITTTLLKYILFVVKLRCIQRLNRKLIKTLEFPKMACFFHECDIESIDYS